MRRVWQSLVVGVALPVCYTFIAGPLSNFTPNRFVRLLLYLPIGWPRYLYYALIPHPTLMRFGDLSFFIYMVVSNILLYTLLTYFCLWALSLRQQSAMTETPPPPPDDLDQNTSPPDAPATSTTHQ
jgi:hypothetical protein